MGSAMKLEAQVTGNIGMYYTCYKLSCMSWNVMPTSRNARGIDIIAYNRTGTDFIGVQVKALSKRNAVPLGNSLEKVMGDYWVIVNNIENEPNVFVLLPEEIKTLAQRNEKDGKLSYWLPAASYDVTEFKEAWHRIGHGHERS
jgi:hypothetical protein